MTERFTGDPLGAFTCVKCGAISIGPRIKWQVDAKAKQYIEIWCDDCGYSEERPTADAAKPPQNGLR